MEERVRGLDLRGDDYLVTPIDMLSRTEDTF